MITDCSHCIYDITCSNHEYLGTSYCSFKKKQDKDIIEILEAQIKKNKQHIARLCGEK